jgi:hypothetical protein
MKKLLLAPALALGLLAAAPAANAAGVSFGIHVGDHDRYHHHHYWRHGYWHDGYWHSRYWHHHRYCRTWGWRYHHRYCRYWGW